MKFVDFDKWERFEQFKFFSQMDDPIWGVTVEMDCTRAYAKAKKWQCSFYLLYLHYSLQAINQVEAFRYRISEDGKVVRHEVINASATVDRSNGTFGYSYINYFEEFESFEAKAKEEIERVRASRDLQTSNGTDNLAYYSTLPWLNFTSLKHARSLNRYDSIPRITFGKLTQNGKKWTMPVSVEVNHALVDGAHVGSFVNQFQALIDE